VATSNVFGLPFFCFLCDFSCIIFAARCYASAAYAIMQCLCVSVCISVSITFVHSVKTRKHIYKMLSPVGSEPILVFQYQTAWQYSDGNPPPLVGASNTGGVGRNRDSEPISGFTVRLTLLLARCYQYNAIGPLSRKLRHFAGSKRRCLLMMRKDDKMFMTRSFNLTPKTTEQHLIARSDNTVQYVTNNKRFCWTLCNIEVKY